jgi:hypothetical protein
MGNLPFQISGLLIEQARDGFIGLTIRSNFGRDMKVNDYGLGVAIMQTG